MSKDNTGTIAVIIIAIILLVLFWGKIGSLFTNNKWTVNISVSPSGAPSTSPSGLVTVNKDKSLTVNASDSTGWAFQSWLLDGISAGNSPVIIIQAQPVNTTHTLVAVFVARSTAFTITPSTTFTQGAVVRDLMLTLKNNEDVSVKNINIRLNDPYGVFTTFPIMYYREYNGMYSPPSYSYTECHNQFSQYYLWQMLDTGSILNAYESRAFQCGGYAGGFPGYEMYFNVQVNSAIQSGTYHLSWTLAYTIVSGTGVPPVVTIPWDVTIV